MNALASLLLLVPCGDAPPPIRLLAPPSLSANSRGRLQRAVENGAHAAAQWLGVPDDRAAADPLDVEYLPSHEAMGLRLGRTRPWLFDEETLRVVFIPPTSGGDGEDADERAAASALACARCAGAFAAILNAVPDARASPFADALAASFDPDDDALRTARDLRSVGQLPTLDELVLGDPRRSPELARVACVSVLRALPVELRASAFADLVAATQPAPRTQPLPPECAAAVARAWTKALDAAAPTARDDGAPPAGLRGFCFSHEGYRWFDGYGSRAAAGSLARLRALGADAVSVTPFAFQREFDRPAIGMLFDGQRRGFAPETDLSVAVTCADAAANGLTVILKPHLWCGHGHWCGEIAMRDPADWPRWFSEYERLAVHYALLARAHRIPIFCIGTELRGTTGHEAEWRALIRKLRAIHPGFLTYCANWSDEVEQLRFWDALDVVGLSAYWPLADAPGADDRSLTTRFEQVLERMRRVGRQREKPVWFLEIGFPDVKDAWLTPHKNDGTPDGGTDQGRAYRIVLETTAAQRFPDGLFFWKWPSRAPDPDRRFDYWPWGRAAEQAVRDAWGGPR